MTERIPTPVIEAAVTPKRVCLAPVKAGELIHVRSVGDLLFALSSIPRRATPNAVEERYGLRD